MAKKMSTAGQALLDDVHAIKTGATSKTWTPEQLCTALAEGLSAQDSDYQPLSVLELKQRARKRHGFI